MKRILFLAPVLALASCAHGLVSTPKQGLYAAFASYESALSGFVVYAQGPTADPKIVHAARLANDGPAVKSAVKIATAYTLCHGDSKATVSGVDCTLVPTGPMTAEQYAIILRSVTTSLLRR